MKMSFSGFGFGKNAWDDEQTAQHFSRAGLFCPQFHHFFEIRSVRRGYASHGFPTHYALHDHDDWLSWKCVGKRNDRDARCTDRKILILFLKNLLFLVLCDYSCYCQ